MTAQRGIKTTLVYVKNAKWGSECVGNFSEVCARVEGWGTRRRDDGPSLQAPTPPTRMASRRGPRL